MSEKIEDSLNEEEISFVTKVVKDGGYRISLPEDVMKTLKLEKEEYVWATLTSRKWHDMVKNDVGDIRKSKTR